MHLVQLLEALELELHEMHPGRFDSNVVPSPTNAAHYLEIIPSHVSKWAGLCALAEHRGIDPASICAVGDEVNDLKMIGGSGLGVAMGNATEAVKVAADFVCGRNDEDGIVTVVDHILALRG